MILSKKEIKETLNPSVLFAIQRKVCLYARVAVEELLKYTEKLEAKEQERTEKLLEIVKELKKDGYDGYAIDILNVIGRKKC